MFNDSQWFYYSEHIDLTNTVQRNVQKSEESKKLPIWRTVRTLNVFRLLQVYCTSITDAGIFPLEV